VEKKSLLSWAFKDNFKLQLLLIIIISVTVFARVLPLEMQKRVINEAIKLRRTDLLIQYCSIYLVAVLSASVLKYLITILQNIIGERVLGRIRKQLYQHILTLPLSFFRKTQPGTVVAFLLTELNTTGTFAGMAFAVPVISVLTLLSFAGYLIWLNPLLAAISLSIYPIVLFLVPLIQRGANKANKKRVDISRTFSSKIAESVSGIHEIQGNGAYRIENRKFKKIVNDLLRIRIIWNLYRQGVKVTNNLFTSLGPLLIFILGGYLTMQGQLELGALVAFLSAQEKLYDPWKELIDYYQVYQDASIRYKRTMAHFDARPDHLLEPVGRAPYDLKGGIDVKDLSFTTDDGIRLLDDISLSLKPGENLALIGFSGSGKSTLALCIGQLYKYTGGHVQIDNIEVSDLTKQDISSNIGFVSQTPFIFSGTIEENLLYSFRAAVHENEDEETMAMPSLDDMIEVLQQTGIFVDVLRFGLNAMLDLEKHSDIVPDILRVRKQFQLDYGDALADYVEFFKEDQYLYHSSVGDNLIFGYSYKDDFLTDNLHKNDYFRKFLDDADLFRPLLSLSAELARQTVDILGNLPHETVFFEQSPISALELDDFKAIVTTLQDTKLHQLTVPDQEKLLELGLRFSPGRHKMAGLPKLLETLILEGRALFREQVLKDDPDGFLFYQMPLYIHSQSILNNILFGKVKSKTPIAQEKINQNIIQLLIEEDLLEKMIDIGMQFEVGSKGDNLSGGQRQKLAIARAFLKSPRILIMDEATSALDNKSQARIQKLINSRWKGRSTLISVVHRLDIIKNYDKIAVLKAGKMIETGTYDQLIEKKGVLYELVFGKQ